MPQCQRYVIDETQTVKFWWGRNADLRAKVPDKTFPKATSQKIIEDGCTCPDGKIFKEKKVTKIKEFKGKSSTTSNIHKFTIMHSTTRYRIDVTTETKMTIYNVEYECVTKQMLVNSLNDNFTLTMEQIDKIDETEIAELNQNLAFLHEKVKQIDGDAILLEPSE